MSGHEWKPGDVGTAVVTTRGPERRKVEYRGGGFYPWLVHDDKGGAVSDFAVEEARPARFLLIDPEDREQVKRLTVGYERDPHPGDVAVADMQAALRSLFNPGRPKEPAGLGAVIEDEDGKRWIRTEGAGSFDKPWSHYPLGIHSHYDAVAVARVLSEGVQP